MYKRQHQHLEQERDFLLQSLDDLEAERAAGTIDEESYTELHDDYTARAAATLRALRDGVDARPARPPVPAARRVLVIGGLVLALRRWRREPHLHATEADERLVAQERDKESAE